jgi:hypothetical protein
MFYNKRGRDVPECLQRVVPELLHRVALANGRTARDGCELLPGLDDGLTIREAPYLIPLVEGKVANGLGDDRAKHKFGATCLS